MAVDPSEIADELWRTGEYTCAESVRRACGCDQELEKDVRCHLEALAAARRELEVSAANAPNVFREAMSEGGWSNGMEVDRYRLLHRLGSGGFGVVWKAIELHSKHVVAIKQLRCGGAEAFQREADTLKKLGQVPGVVNLLRTGEDEVTGRKFLVMEFVEGDPLDVWLQGRDLPQREICELLAQIAEIVGRMHSTDLKLGSAGDGAVVHCDLKPKNIIRKKTGQIMVVDFGIATELSDQRGVYGYPRGNKVPESILDRRPSEESDLFQIALIAYKLLTGHEYWSSDDPGKRLTRLRELMYGINPRQEESSGRWSGRRSAGRVAIACRWISRFASGLKWKLDAVEQSLDWMPSRRIRSGKQFAFAFRHPWLWWLVMPDWGRWRRRGAFLGSVAAIALLIALVISQRDLGVAQERVDTRGDNWWFRVDEGEGLVGSNYSNPSSYTEYRESPTPEKAKELELLLRGWIGSYDGLLNVNPNVTPEAEAMYELVESCLADVHLDRVGREFEFRSVDVLNIAGTFEFGATTVKIKINSDDPDEFWSIETTIGDGETKSVEFSAGGVRYPPIRWRLGDTMHVEVWGVPGGDVPLEQLEMKASLLVGGSTARTDQIKLSGTDYDLTLKLGDAAE